VLTYNLFWWSLFGIRGGQGGSAGKLIASNSRSMPFDFMAFQECEQAVLVLQDAGLADWYDFEHASRHICVAYRTSVWRRLSYGVQDVAEDMQAQYYGKRSAQWMRLQHKEHNGTFVFLMNHHGPLPVDTGGVCGGMATAFNLLKLIHTHARDGDAVILAGDFNSGSSAITVMEMQNHMHRAYWGRVLDGIDNIFTNLGQSAIVHRENLGTGGSDHDALSLVLELKPSHSAPSREIQAHCGRSLRDVDFSLEGTVALRTRGGRYIVVKDDGTVCTHSRFENSSRLIQRPGVGSNESFQSYHGAYLAMQPDGRIRTTFENISAAQKFERVPHHDGTFSWRASNGNFVAAMPDGSVMAVSNTMDSQTKFVIEESVWEFAIDHTPDEDMCCAMCQKRVACRAWVFTPAAGLAGPWPGRCALRGGGVVKKTRAVGHISGFASHTEEAQDLQERKELTELLRRGQHWGAELVSITTTLPTNPDSAATTTGSLDLAAASSKNRVGPKSLAYHWPSLTVATTITTTRTVFTTSTAVTTSTTTLGVVLNSGDVVNVKSASGEWLTTFGEAVSTGRSPAQFVVEKLKVTGILASGHWKEIACEVVQGVIHSGEMVSLRGPSGRYLDVEHDLVRARWDHHTPQQTLVVQGGHNLTVHSGDRVFLMPALNKNFVDVEGGAVRARWNIQGDLQVLTMETASVMPSIRVLDN